MLFILDSEIGGGVLRKGESCGITNGWEKLDTNKMLVGSCSSAKSVKGKSAKLNIPKVLNKAWNMRLSYEQTKKLPL